MTEDYDTFMVVRDQFVIRGRGCVITGSLLQECPEVPFEIFLATSPSTPVPGDGWTVTGIERNTIQNWNRVGSKVGLLLRKRTESFPKPGDTIYLAKQRVL